jgi:hypothetical protein
VPPIAPPVRPDVPGGPRNGLGAVTFVIVVLGALLAVFPSTAVFGLLVCLLALVPAFVAHRRTRKGTATNRGQSVAALAMAPAFLVTAFVVIGATASPQVTTTSDTSQLVSPPSSPAAVAPLLAAPAAPAPTSTTVEVAPVADPAPVTAKATRRPVATSRATVVKPAPKPAPAVRAVAASARSATVAPAPVVQPLAAPPSSKPVEKSSPKPVAKPKPVAQPSEPAPAPVDETPPATCDAQHYKNDAGECVPRPDASSSVDNEKPSARCKDGKFSYSKSRPGTCSGHGGVDEWLKNL